MKRNDFILTLALLIVFAVIPLMILFKKSDSEKVYVEVDGKLYASFDLLEDRREEITTEHGFNVLVISDGKVYIEASDCKNHECMDMGSIDNPYKHIICLPHFLDIYISSDDSKVDTVAY